MTLFYLQYALCTIAGALSLSSSQASVFPCGVRKRHMLPLHSVNAVPLLVRRVAATTGATAAATAARRRRRRRRREALRLRRVPAVVLDHVDQFDDVLPLLVLLAHVVGVLLQSRKIFCLNSVFSCNFPFF